MTPPDQPPGLAVSSSPTFAVPEMVGGEVFAGAPDDETTPLKIEFAVDWPSAFVAVTTARSRWSTSVEAGVYVLLVAPEMSAQPDPSEAQRCHWYENEVGLLSQVPLLTVSV